MELREARRLLKEEAGKATAMLKVYGAIELLEGGDAKLESLLKQKEVLEAAIAAKKKTFLEESQNLDQELAARCESVKVEMADLDTKLKAKQDALIIVQKQHADEVNRGRTVQKEITAGLVGERTTQVAALDKQIATKTAKLQQVTEELAKVLAKVGA